MTDVPAALVTGASRGIGRAIATHLAAAGFDIAAVDLRHPASDAPCSLETLKQEIEALGQRCAYAHADVADLESHDAVLSKILDELGRLDLLVSNAGIAPD